MPEARYQWVNASKNVQNEHPLIRLQNMLSLSSPELEPGMMPNINEKEQKGISDLSLRLK